MDIPKRIDKEPVCLGPHMIWAILNEPCYPEYCLETNWFIIGHSIRPALPFIQPHRHGLPYTMAKSWGNKKIKKYFISMINMNINIDKQIPHVYIYIYILCNITELMVTTLFVSGTFFWHRALTNLPMPTNMHPEGLPAKVLVSGRPGQSISKTWTPCEVTQSRTKLDMSTAWQSLRAQNLLVALRTAMEQSLWWEKHFTPESLVFCPSGIHGCTTYRWWANPPPNPTNQPTNQWSFIAAKGPTLSKASLAPVGHIAMASPWVLGRKGWDDKNSWCKWWLNDG